MTKLWHSIVRRFFPGTIEEYYATRKMRGHEFKTYGRQANYIAGSLFFAVPLLIVTFANLGFVARALLLLLSVWGMACIRDAIEEHYCLLLLRRSSGNVSKV